MDEDEGKTWLIVPRRGEDPREAGRSQRRRGARFRKRARRGLVTAVVGVGALCALALTGGALWSAREALALRAELRAAQADLEVAAAVAEPVLGDFQSLSGASTALEGVEAHLATADQSLTSAQRRLERLRPVLALGRPLPGWPGALHETPQMVALARDLSAAGGDGARAYRLLSSRIETQTPDEPAAARVAAGLESAAPLLKNAHQRLGDALDRRTRLDAAQLTGPLAPGARALDTFDRHAGRLRGNLDLLVLLPDAAHAMLGMDAPRTYVVLGQNSTELRPTGGFIGSLGVLTLDKGRTVREDYRGAYTFDNPARGFEPLPEPLARHLGPGGWAVRDANWSPDFPTSAAKVEEILARQQDLQVDGVIGITTYTVGILLDTLGPVQVESLPVPVTAADWYGLAEEQIYFAADSNRPGRIEQKKGQVLEPVMRAVIARLQNASGDELPKVYRALKRAVQERQLMVTVRDPAAAALVTRYAADGAMTAPAASDVVAVVDANVSYSKVGPRIRQRLDYDVWLNAAGAPVQSRLTVSYANTLTPAEAATATDERIGGLEYDPAVRRTRDVPGLYGTYTRVYVPRNSVPRDLGPAPLPVTTRELGFTTFERYQRVQPGEAARFSYTYQLPTDLCPPGRYQLLLRKQPGTSGPEVEVRIHLPAGITATSDTPGLDLPREGDALVLRGRLTQDVKLSVRVDTVSE